VELFSQYTVWSGGQTGVDQGALEAAIVLGMPHGGWCPAGRKSESGAIPQRFLLTEHASAKYPPRTKKNIQETDGTLILGKGDFGSQGVGTKLTASIATDLCKPMLYENLSDVFDTRTGLTRALALQKGSCSIRDWLHQHNIYRLNVAGSRESSNPGIQTLTHKFLLYVLFPYRTKDTV